MSTNGDHNRLLPNVVGKIWSITGRLTLLYVGATTLLLVLAAGYLHWGLARSLELSDRALVTGKFRVLQGLLQENEVQGGVLENEIEHEASVHELLKYYLRISDVHGKVLLETTGMSGLLPVSLFPEAKLLTEASLPIERRTLTSGRSYLLLSGEVLGGLSGSDRRIVQIGMDVGHSQTLLAGYRKNLFMVLGFGLVFAAIGGVLVTRTGLRPIRVMESATRRISASNLEERLQPARWPTELRELAAGFDAMLDRLHESFGRLKGFSADIAHALRNPINNLRGEAEVALGQPGLPVECQHILGSSLEELQRLSRMIDGLLFIARTDDPAVTTERCVIEARREMDAVVEFYEALAGEKKITLVCEGEARLNGDPMLIRRALSNLLANSLKFTPAGGRVVLAAANDASGAAEIRVSDNGPGIQPEHLPRIFDRFFQGKRSRDQTTEGAGLGLTIVQSIMRLHKGQVEATSVVGHGTTMVLRFPSGK